MKLSLSRRRSVALSASQIIPLKNAIDHLASEIQLEREETSSLMHIIKEKDM
jgi:hypothetical protein